MVNQDTPYPETTPTGTALHGSRRPLTHAYARRAAPGSTVVYCTHRRGHAPRSRASLSLSARDPMINAQIMLMIWCSQSRSTGQSYAHNSLIIRGIAPHSDSTHSNISLTAAKSRRYRTRTTRMTIPSGATQRHTPHTATHTAPHEHTHTHTRARTRGAHTQ